MGGKRKRPCRICGADLNAWGNKKGICPNCASEVRSSLVDCAGRCGKQYPLRMMDGVSLYFDAGQKGGKKYRLYYCSACASAAKSRARMIHEQQEDVLEKFERRLSRGAKVRGATLEKKCLDY